MLRKSLIHHHRGVARAALYLLPVMLVGVTLALASYKGYRPPDNSWHREDYTRFESVRLFQEYLRFDTSYPDGNEIPAAEFLAAQLEAAGITTHLERLGPRNANLWAILEGEDPQALVLHNHIDVEPADPEGWRYPPFGGVLAPPFIYGRGAFDMKSLGIAQLVTMLEIQRRGTALRRSLIFLATGDEERDSRLGTRWVLRQHPELAQRAYAVLTEGGAVEATTTDTVKYWGTELHQKRFVDIWVCAVRRQRLEDLRQEVMQLEPVRRQATGEIARFLEIYGGSRDNPLFRRLLRQPGKLHQSPEFEQLPGHIKATLRNEVVAFPIEEDPESGYKMRLILHLLPDMELAEVFQELLPGGLEDFDFTIDVPHEPVQSSSFDHPVFRSIHEYMGRVLPDIYHGPLFLAWVATDSRFFRGAGIPSYGFSPFLILSGDSMKMKGKNERMAAPSFVAGVELYRGLVEHLVE